MMSIPLQNEDVTPHVIGPEYNKLRSRPLITIARLLNDAYDKIMVRFLDAFPNIADT